MADSLEIEETSAIRGAYFISIKMQYQPIIINNSELNNVGVAL